MKVVALESSKGGTGKSTLSIHLSVALEAIGLVVALLDLDPQASAAVWSDHRGQQFPAVVCAQAPRLRGLLRQAEDKGADIVVLDTPPHADGVSAEAGAVADLILIPCRPSSLDLDAVGATIRVARSAGTPAWVIINAAPVQGVEVAETKAALEESGVNCAPVVLHHRKAYSSRMHEGLTAGEHDPKGKASAEIDALLTWLLGVIGLPVERGSGVADNLLTMVAGERNSREARV